MRRPIHLALMLVSLCCLGCPMVEEPVGPVAAPLDQAEPVEQLVARTLDQNLKGRQLSSQTHGAWQILHGILAYGDQFEIETPEGSQPALRYLLEGKPVNGFEPVAGNMIGNPPRPGLQMAMQPATKVGQGHRDQWLAVLSQCGLPMETEIRSPAQTFTIGDWVRQAEYDVPRNLELEFSWSLIALTRYHSTDHRWTARDGNQYSTADLVESELQQSIPSSVCGGTHRLIGIAMSLNKRRAEEKPITGIWLRAENVLAAAIEDARRNQNPDGSYSVAYLHRPGWTRDLGEALGTTGHVLEFLAFAASDQTLTEPWVERTARRLCEILAECQGVDLECGVLYHALHGLQEYRGRLGRMEAANSGSAS